MAKSLHQKIEFYTFDMYQTLKVVNSKSPHPLSRKKNRQEKSTIIFINLNKIIPRNKDKRTARVGKVLEKTILNESM